MVLYFPTPTSLNKRFCTTWQNRETRKLHIFAHILYYCVSAVQPVAAILEFCWNSYTTHIRAIIDSLNLVVSQLEFKGQGWTAIPTQWRKAIDILTSTPAALLFSSHPKNENRSRRSLKLLRKCPQEWQTTITYQDKTARQASELRCCTLIGREAAVFNRMQITSYCCDAAYTGKVRNSMNLRHEVGCSISMRLPWTYVWCHCHIL